MKQLLLTITDEMNEAIKEICVKRKVKNRQEAIKEILTRSITD